MDEVQPETGNRYTGLLCADFPEINFSNEPESPTRGIGQNISALACIQNPCQPDPYRPAFRPIQPERLSLSRSGVARLNEEEDRA